LEEVSREDRKVSREQEWRRGADFQLIKHVEGQLEVFPEVNRMLPHENKNVVGGGGGGGQTCAAEALPRKSEIQS
jgi:hypothetical protein